MIIKKFLYRTSTALGTTCTRSCCNCIAIETTYTLCNLHLIKLMNNWRLRTRKTKLKLWKEGEQNNEEKVGVKQWQEEQTTKQREEWLTKAARRRPTEQRVIKATSRMTQGTIRRMIGVTITKETRKQAAMPCWTLMNLTQKNYSVRSNRFVSGYLMDIQISRYSFQP